jgi:hypothetical protein
MKQPKTKSLSSLIARRISDKFNRTSEKYGIKKLVGYDGVIDLGGLTVEFDAILCHDGKQCFCDIMTIEVKDGENTIKGNYNFLKTKIERKVSALQLNEYTN